jgi:hypothetical protein
VGGAVQGNLSIAGIYHYEQFEVPSLRAVYRQLVKVHATAVSVNL